jgi:Fe-S-cluster containining protein
MIKTTLKLSDELPLTCSRKGTCCFGNKVTLNPWELALLANEKQISASKFRELYCDLGGIRLKFDGVKDKQGNASCSQYSADFGCSVHIARPLACRLFPIGRQIQNEKVDYIYQGSEFPCLSGCPEVTSLPYISVEKYLKEQSVAKFEQAQDVYLELMQDLADSAFTLLLDTGLSDMGDKETLRKWRISGAMNPETLANRIGTEWINELMSPSISVHLEEPLLFAQLHSVQIQTKVNSVFGSLKLNNELHEASVFLMSLSLILASAIGADPKTLSELWITTAKKNGALE